MINYKLKDLRFFNVKLFSVRSCILCSDDLCIFRFSFNQSTFQIDQILPVRCLTLKSLAGAGF